MGYLFLLYCFVLLILVAMIFAINKLSGGWQSGGTRFLSAVLIAAIGFITVVFLWILVVVS
jgi:hypothetical protein